jgi:uncharacterized protein (UPF0332 family)
LLAKAERALHAARTLHNAEDYEFAAGRAYYSMFYSAQALLHERGLRFSKHSGVHAAFGKEFAKTARLDPKYHRWLLAAFNTRLEADYGMEIAVSQEDVEDLLQRGREFLTAARELLQGQ